MGRGCESVACAPSAVTHHCCPTVRLPACLQVSHMASFNTSAFPDSLALGKAEALLIGTIDEIQVCGAGVRGEVGAGAG